MRSPDAPTLLTEPELETLMDDLAATGAMRTDLPVSQALFQVLERIAFNGRVDESDAVEARKLRQQQEDDENIEEADEESDTPE